MAAQVRYGPRTEFGRALRDGVAAALQEHDTRAVRRRLWRRALVVVLWFYGTFGVLVFVPLPPWAAALAAVSLGAAGAGTLMSISHGAAHGSFAKDRRVNRAIALATAPFGISASWWAVKHNVLHHGYTNVSGMDNDLDFGAVARFSPAQPWRPWHRWQHIYLWACYPWLYLSIVLSGDVRFVLWGRVGGRRMQRPSVRRAAILATEKLAGLALLLALALALRPAAAVGGVFVVAALVCGSILALVFQVEHLVETSVVPSQDRVDGRVTVEWDLAQVQGAADVATNNRILTCYVGALNLHVEHHLFPHIPQGHLPLCVPVVREVCRAHGVEVAEYRTFRAALASHQRLLRRLGAPRYPVPAEASRRPVAADMIATPM